MNVSDLMNGSPHYVSPGASVMKIARLMVDLHVAGLPVVDDEQRLLGLVTDEDVVAKHARLHLPWYLGIAGTLLPLETRRTDEEIRHILATTARDLMTPRPETIGPDTTIDDAASIMVEKRLTVLPVVDAGRVVGLLSREDIIRLVLVEEAGDETEDL